MTSKKQTPNFPPNSIREKVPIRNNGGSSLSIESEDEEEIQEVEEQIKKPRGRIKKRKRNTLFSFLFREGKEIVVYVWEEVFIPGIKEMFQTSLENGIDMIFNGPDEYEDRHGRRRRSGGPRIISYNDYFQDNSRSRKSRRTPRPRKMSRIDGISFEFAAEARQVLSSLIDLQREYGSVSVSDYLEASGMSEAVQTMDTVRGWGEEIRRAKILKTKDNDYVIDLPKERNISE